MTKKVLVVFYSRDGATERISRQIAERLGADVDVIAVCKSTLGDCNASLAVVSCSLAT